jgi:neurofibromin 1
MSDPAALRAEQDLAQLKDKDLLLNTAIELVDFQYLEDAVQNRSLQWLNRVALARPGVAMHLYVLLSPSIPTVHLQCCCLC